MPSFGIFLFFAWSAAYIPGLDEDLIVFDILPSQSYLSLDIVAQF